MCIDYQKLNKSTQKDHFPLPFIDQMLERLVGYECYCFLDGYLGYNQIAIALEDQEKTKRWHDNLILRMEFHPGWQVLLFNSWLRLFSGKLKSRWSGPFKIKQRFPFRAVELWDKNGQVFRVNGQWLKHYYGGEERKVGDIQLEDPQQ